MKKTIIFAVICVFFMSIAVSAAETVNVVINGKPLNTDAPAQIIDGRTMVPMRAVFEALDASIAWDNDTKTVTADKGGTEIKMTIGAAEFYKNGESIALDTPAQIIDGRTLVPVRAVSESLGCTVNWDAAAKTVDITNGTAGKNYTFRNEKLLKEHFEKHGGDFDYSDAAEYQAGASRVVTDSRALHKLEKEDGDDVYYIEATNEFVVVSTDGYIRTYFKPDSGKAYFDRQ